MVNTLKVLRLPGALFFVINHRLEPRALSPANGQQTGHEQRYTVQQGVYGVYPGVYGVYIYREVYTHHVYPGIYTRKDTHHGTGLNTPGGIPTMVPGYTPP